MARDGKYVAFTISKKVDASRSQLRRYTFHRNLLFALVGAVVLLAAVVAVGFYGLTQHALHRQTAADNAALEAKQRQDEQQRKELNERIKALEEQSRRIAQLAASANAQTPQPQPANDTTAPSQQSHAPRKGKGGPELPLFAAGDVADDITPEEMARRVALLEKKLRDYEAIIMQQAIRPSIWPAIGRLSDFFGPRRNPFGGGGEFHSGQDIANAVGTPIVATANGTVVFSGWQSGYGRLVEIDHGNGITTRYGHLSKLEVEVGQEITRGQVLGLMGSSGRSTGSHVHYEVRINDETVNPLDYLPREPWVEAELQK
jgi:murein DD-endopeptidase MepM/ murein hydrolase activator NlpD